MIEIVWSNGTAFCL